MGDLEERKRWDDYQAAFDEALTRTSTAWAPWYVIPANRKWFRNLAVASILADTMADLRPRYPAGEDLPGTSSSSSGTTVRTVLVARILGSSARRLGVHG